MGKKNDANTLRRAKSAPRRPKMSPRRFHMADDTPKPPKMLQEVQKDVQRCLKIALLPRSERASEASDASGALRMNLGV